jgi:hypothetical protein
MMAVLFAALLASPIAASSYDPHRPPWVYLLQPGDADSGDESGFGEMDSVGPSRVGYRPLFEYWVSPYVRLVIIGIFGPIIDNPVDNGNTGTGSTQRSTGSNSQ